LPSRFLDGAAYREGREALAKRFQSVQIVSLPDGVFEKSDMETVLVLGTEPRAEAGRKLSISLTHVNEKDRSGFLREYSFTRRDHAERSQEDARSSLNVVALRDMWERLKPLPTLGGVAKIHKGVEWASDTQQNISEEPRSGFRLGVYTAHEALSYERPVAKYLCFQREKKRLRAPGGFDLPWDEPKVFVNTARVSRGPWRLAAFADSTGLIANKRFFGVWPKHPWTAEAIEGLLNSAIANAYVACYDLHQRDVRKSTLEGIPLPVWTESEIENLGRLVVDYRSIGNRSVEQVRESLLAIDALILKGYRLPPRLERELLNLFQGVRRPVRFEFTEFFPEGFTANIPLWMFLSPDYKRCTASNLLKRVPVVTDPQLIAAFEEVAQ
jgi:hypothetical protein